MTRETKPIVQKETGFDQLEIRLGKIISVEPENSAPKPAYRLTIDFGKYGKKDSVGRFTMHSEEELVNSLVVGVLNFGSRQIGSTVSDVLVLGVQFPKADSGEATPITPLNQNAKIGGKLF